MPLTNKYLRYTPEITFEVFEKIWNKLLEHGWISNAGYTIQYRWREFSGDYPGFQSVNPTTKKFFTGSIPDIISSVAETTVDEILNFGKPTEDSTILYKDLEVDKVYHVTWGSRNECKAFFRFTKDVTRRPFLNIHNRTYFFSSPALGHEDNLRLPTKDELLWFEYCEKNDKYISYEDFIKLPVKKPKSLNCTYKELEKGKFYMCNETWFDGSVAKFDGLTNNDTRFHYSWGFNPYNGDADVDNYWDFDHEDVFTEVPEPEEYREWLKAKKVPDTINVPKPILKCYKGQQGLKEYLTSLGNYMGSLDGTFDKSYYYQLPGRTVMNNSLRECLEQKWSKEYTLEFIDEIPKVIEELKITKPKANTWYKNTSSGEFSFCSNAEINRGQILDIDTGDWEIPVAVYNAEGMPYWIEVSDAEHKLIQQILLDKANRNYPLGTEFISALKNDPNPYKGNVRKSFYWSTTSEGREVLFNGNSCGFIYDNGVWAKKVEEEKPVTLQEIIDFKDSLFYVECTYSESEYSFIEGKKYLASEYEHDSKRFILEQPKENGSSKGSDFPYEGGLWKFKKIEPEKSYLVKSIFDQTPLIPQPFEMEISKRVILFPVVEEITLK